MVEDDHFFFLHKTMNRIFDDSQRVALRGIVPIFTPVIPMPTTIDWSNAAGNRTFKATWGKSFKPANHLPSII